MTRISIITPALNNVQTLPMTLDSVRLQEYADIEHIVVDGGSRDDTVALLETSPAVTWVSEADNGLYDAINKGIRMATGEVIGVLNADDFLAGPGVIRDLVSAFGSADAVYRDVCYVHPRNLRRVVRHYSSAAFKPGMFLSGFMPAHPSFYARRTLFDVFGDYRSDYRICADYELLLRFILIHSIRTRYVPGTHTVMRTGGVSNATPLSRLQLNREMVRACRENGVTVSLRDMFWKYPVKVLDYVRPGLDTPVRLNLDWLIPRAA